MQNYLQIIFSTLLLFIFTACEDKSLKDTPLVFEQAYLIDAPVEGVTFTSSSNNGVTDINGSFTYSNLDAIVSFSIGGIHLADFNLSKLNNDKNVLITDLVGVARDDSSNPQVIKILQLLQSLDDDKNVSNGITITPTTASQLADSNLDFSNFNLSIEDINTSLQSIGSSLVGQTAAVEHFEQTLNNDFNYSLDSIAPEFHSLDTANVMEGESFVVDLEIYDSSAITIALSGEDASSFDLNGTSLSFITAPDYEIKPSYSLNITATDTHQNSTTQNFHINILDDGIDETAPVFRSNNLIKVNENQKLVINLEIYDSSAVRLTLGGADANLFELSGRTLLFKNAPDFEFKTNYSLSVTASDTRDNRATQNIQIEVQDVGGLDDDGDFIPNDIETLLGMDLTNSDENNNSILDGLESNATFGDQFFDKQWHIRSLGTYTNDSNVSTIAGNDLDVLDIYHTYMGYNHGDNIIIQVVDTGVDADHEDLVDNMDLSRSYNDDVIGDPSGSDWHGTAVAGIMAARAFNTIGVRGIIPFAKIAGSNWLNYQTYEGIEKVFLSGDGANEIAVTNNSWGDYISSETSFEEIMALGTSTLRDAKGRIYVFAGGNARHIDGSSNLSYLTNNHYVITVAALKNDNTYTLYSSSGSNILVSGYSGEFYQNSPTISTTIIAGESNNEGNLTAKTTWSEDTKENYTYIMNGTSAASPTVAASIALVLEACPDLTWRDVKYLVATTAKIVDANNSTWIQNSAGHKHSIDYGYGLINPQGMISECLSSSFEHIAQEQNQSVSQTFNTPIPDNNSTTTSFELEITETPISVEWVAVTIDNNSTHASDYEVSLVSPAGTKTLLIQGGNLGSDLNYDGVPAWMDNGFRLSSVAMLDESSQGVWRVNIKDMFTGDSGTLKSIKLQIYGH